jgi:hypothetical protein
MLWEATKLAYIIHLLLVSNFWKFPTFTAYSKLFPATSGACATIASDALMNPFDGKISPRIPF